MSDTLLPFRFRLLDYLGSVDSATPKESMVALESEYGQMKYFNLPEVEEHFLSMRANGIADEIDVQLDEDGQVEARYRITDFGRELLDKYLPSWYTRG